MKKNITHKLRFVTPVLLACMLAACGGGEDGDAATAADAASAPGAAAPDVTGSVSAPFAQGATSRMMLFGVGSQRFGMLASSKHEASGAMTVLDDAALSGAAVVREIAGDTHFAQGRWAGGTVTTKSGASTLAGTAAYHYIAFNTAAAFPASGSLTCDGGVFTKPTYIGGGTTGFDGPITSTGNMSVSFDASGAVLRGAVSGSANSTTATVRLDQTVMTPAMTASTGNLFGGAGGAVIALGDAGPGAYKVLSAYVAMLASGARYQGVVTFHCK